MQCRAHVTIADINEDLGQKLVDQLAEERLKYAYHRCYFSTPITQTDIRRVNFIRTDVTSWDSQVAAFKSAIKHGGHNGIDIVCAVAGLGGVPFIMPNEEAASLEKDPPKPPMVDANYDVNAKGVYLTSKLAQHYFGLKSRAQQEHRKVLILISSLCGYLEINNAEYCSTKWAVRGFFRSIRSIMENMGYRTNLIAPWVMDTPMSNYFAKICREQGIAVGNVNDVVDAVVRCAADDSINGIAPWRSGNLELVILTWTCRTCFGNWRREELRLGR